MAGGISPQPVPDYGFLPYPTLSQAYDAYYTQCLAQKQLVSSKAALTASVSDHLDRLYKRLSIQNDVLCSPPNPRGGAAPWELILAYLHEIPRERIDGW